MVQVVVEGTMRLVSAFHFLSLCGREGLGIVMKMRSWVLNYFEVVLQLRTHPQSHRLEMSWTVSRP